MAPQEARKLGLVPEDVPDRRPVPLGDGLEAHRAGGKLEERHVLLEDKERDFMLGRRGNQGAHERKHILADSGTAALHDGG